MQARRRGHRTDARAHDLFLDGWAANYNDGYAAALPALRRGLAIFGQGMSPEAELRWLWHASNAALHLWDDARWVELVRRGTFSSRAIAVHSASFRLP